MFIAQKLDLPAHPTQSWWGGFDEIQIFEDESGGLAYDLSGATIVLEVKESQAQDAVAVATWTTADSSITISEAVNGKFKVVGRNITLPAKRYYYGIKITPANGESFVVVYGEWRITNLPI
ncbi:hypothetical protein [Cerasicoccus frondis]|uniref:hypothetical protein n=1 Tax=Cerasicoccus frondis TaxID=490090 RepID=UPI002852573B|nr:hypothetical protein [Cerasicoccus frondis]